MAGKTGRNMPFPEVPLQVGLQSDNPLRAESVVELKPDPQGRRGGLNSRPDQMIKRPQRRI